MLSKKEFSITKLNNWTENTGTFSTFSLRVLYLKKVASEQTEFNTLLTYQILETKLQDQVS